MNNDTLSVNVCQRFFQCLWQYELGLRMTPIVRLHVFRPRYSDTAPAEEVVFAPAP